LSTGTRWMPLERASGLLFVALVSALTLEWISLGGFLAGNIKYFHLAAGAFMVVYLARYRPSRRLAPVLGRYRAFYGPWVFYLLLVAVLGLAHTEPYFSRSELLRQAFYGATSVFVAAFCFDTDGRNVRQILKWTGVTTVVVVVTSITLALFRQGTNPLRLIGEAIAKGDPDIVSYQLLRLSFRSQELAEVGANLRHKVFSAVLIGLAVSLICRERARGPNGRWRDRLFRVSTILGALIVVVSLSRSLILCMGIALALYGLRVLIQSQASPRQLTAVLATLVVVVALAASPLGALVWTRLTGGTGSYQGRFAALDLESLPSSVDAAIVGVEASEVTKSPHNLVIDAWLSAGVLGAVSAAWFFFAYLRVWLSQVRRYLTGAPGWVLSLQQFWTVALGILPVVRAVTAGNGFHLNDWVCVGMVFGLVEANRRAAVQQRSHHASLPTMSRQSRAHLAAHSQQRSQTPAITGGRVPGRKRP
jgi:hypothetical protein